MRKEPVVLRLSDGEKVGTAELDRLLDDIGVPKPRFYSYQRGKDPSKSASMAEIDRQQRGGLDEKETGRERGIGKENGTEKGTERGGRGKESERGRKEEDPQVPPPPLRVPVPDNVPTGTRRVSSLELKTFLCGALAGGAAGACTSPLESIRTRVIAHKGGDSTMQLLQRTAQEEGMRKSVLSASLKMSITMNGLNRGIQFYVFEMVKKASKKWTGREDHKILPLHSAIPTSSLAGAAGAFASTVVTYPFSAVSDHMSLQPGMYNGLRDALVGITKTHGAAQLYRGIVPKLCSMVPAGAMSFYTFDTLKQELQRRMRREITAMESLSIGAIAGLVSTLTTYPLELARKEINMSLLPMSATRTGGFGKYNNMGQALRGIVRSGGFAGLYRGVLASALEVVPSTAISFMVYEAAKRALIAEKHEEPEEVKG